MIKKYLSCLALLPLFLFILIARYKGLFSDTSTQDINWQEPFYYAGVVALAIIMFLVVMRIPVNRFLLALNLWLISSAILFLWGNEFLLTLLSNYSGPFLFGILMLVGLCTLGTKGGFIGITKDVRPTRVFRYSLVLLGGCLLAFLWAITFNENGIFLSIIFPLIALRVLQSVLEYRLERL